MSFSELDLARAHHGALVAEAENRRRAHRAATARRLQRRAVRLSHRAERVSRRAEQAATRARLLVARAL